MRVESWKGGEGEGEEAIRFLMVTRALNTIWRRPLEKAEEIEKFFAKQDEE